MQVTHLNRFWQVKQELNATKTTCLDPSAGKQVDWLQVMKGGRPHFHRPQVRTGRGSTLCETCDGPQETNTHFGFTQHPRRLYCHITVSPTSASSCCHSSAARCSLSEVNLASWQDLDVLQSYAGQSISLRYRSSLFLTRDSCLALSFCSGLQPNQAGWIWKSCSLTGESLNRPRIIASDVRKSNPTSVYFSSCLWCVFMFFGAINSSWRNNCVLDCKLPACHE